MRSISSAVIVICILSLSAAPSASARTYTAIELYPLAGYQSPRPPYLNLPNIAAGGQVVGQAGFPAHALVYEPDGSWTDLNPSGFDASVAWGTDGAWQVGTAKVGNNHAFLWHGSAQTAVDLNPAGMLGSTALATYAGTQQVGYGDVGNGHALLWSGNATSVVDLNPNGFLSSTAEGTDGHHQVGYGSAGNQQPSHALLWSGTAASAVDLNPNGSLGSQAWGVNGNQQVGEYSLPAAPGAQHPVLWLGTSASAVDLTPTGFQEGTAFGTNGLQQVGWGDGTATGGTGHPHALVWSGSSASMIDLHTFLPSTAPFGGTIAQSIDPAGDVFGIAIGAMGSGLPPFAMEWVPHTVQPGDTNLDGKVDFNDLVTLSRNYGHQGGWVQGDFDWDQIVDFGDLVMLARNYGQTLTAAQLSQFDPAFRADVERAFAVVPEPSSFCLVTLVATTMLRRRRR